MAVYTHLEVVGSPTGYWGDQDATFVGGNSGVVVLTNTDGSQTRLFSSNNDFTFVPSGGTFVLTGGTITSMTRTNADDTTTYEQITGLNYPATSFQGHMNDSNLQGVLNDVFAGADTFNGFSGNDIFVGGTGDDLYFVGPGDTVTENLNAGNDTIVPNFSGFVLPANVENAILGLATGGTLTGNGLDNALFGNAGNDTLNGGAGNDFLDGQGGADTMVGGTGNDIYVINNLGDVITENLNEGNDTAYIGVSGYTLGANVENGLILLTSGTTLTGNGLDNALYGNAGDDTLNGGGGNDTLDGGAGADTMAGGTGNDLFAVDNLGDIIIENAGEGNDTAYVVVSGYTLGANVEGGIIGITTGATLTGNGSNNGLFGNAGNDTLNGGGGNDTLDGGAGADTLVGGTGNDTYFVDNLGDVIIENPNEGTDTVNVVVSGYTLADNVENGQILIGGGATLIGNGSNNVLSGNAGNDTLDGGAGNDTLVGGGGNDTFVFKDGYGADTVFDFKASGNQDVVDFTAVSSFHTFADVQAHAAQVGSDTVITIDANNSLTLLGVQLNTLQQQDFLLTP